MPLDPKLKEVADNLVRELADRGQIIEGGWRAMELLAGLKNAPEIQRQEMRRAFFFGAEHLFASILQVMGEDREPTETDLKRMDLIYEELKRFTAQQKK